MFSIITKAQYFDWVSRGFCSLQRQELKNVQDGCVLSFLDTMRAKKILEAGGGISRVLPRLHKSCELWNADKLEGDGNGPNSSNEDQRIRLVRAFVGDFSPELENEYFDAIFSVSVVEHIPSEFLPSFLDDSIRLMKVGGISVHAVDLSICDAEDLSKIAYQNQNAKIELYRDLTEKRSSRIEWLEPPTLRTPVTASAKFAVNSNNTLYRWAKRFPSRRKHREVSQSVSLIWAFRKIA